MRESVRAGLPLEVELDAVAPFSWLYEYRCDSRLRAAADAHPESWPNCDRQIAAVNADAGRRTCGRASGGREECGHSGYDSVDGARG